MAATATETGSSRLADLERDGFVVVRSLVSGDRLTALREACRRVEQLARRGEWPHVRTVGKQFPPWRFEPDKGIWGVQHLLNPALPGSGVFADVYFSDEVLGVVRELLRCGDDDMVMELFNLLVRPERDFELRWHRDDIGPEASAAEETERLGRPAFHAQYNLALWEDESLVVVPGSQRRARSAAERAAGPFEAALPGQVVVRLGAGDAVFYDNNVLHRGVYSSARERATLHGSVGHAGGSAVRARNVLQHGVGEWVADVDLGGLGGGRRRARAEGMRRRLVRLGTERGGDVGYSLEG